MGLHLLRIERIRSKAAAAAFCSFFLTRHHFTVVETGDIFVNPWCTRDWFSPEAYSDGDIDPEAGSDCAGFLSGQHGHTSTFSHKTAWTCNFFSRHRTRRQRCGGLPCLVVGRSDTGPVDVGSTSRQVCGGSGSVYRMFADIC